MTECGETIYVYSRTFKCTRDLGHEGDHIHGETFERELKCARCPTGPASLVITWPQHPKYVRK